MCGWERALHGMQTSSVCSEINYLNLDGMVLLLAVRTHRIPNWAARIMPKTTRTAANQTFKECLMEIVWHGIFHVSISGFLSVCVHRLLNQVVRLLQCLRSSLSRQQQWRPANCQCSSYIQAHEPPFKCGRHHTKQRWVMESLLKLGLWSYSQTTGLRQMTQSLRKSRLGFL